MKYLKYLWQQVQITRSFPKKLKRNFHELTFPERIIYFLFIRPSFAAPKKFFFEGNRGLPGQLYLAERQAIFETIIEYQPRHCFEIGTYTGGGSTFFISSAFSKLGNGKLITMENSDYYFNKARNYYLQKLPTLSNYIDFVHGHDASAFDQYLKKYETVDCVFFDGDENSQQTLDQYNYFLPHFKTGSIIIMHDWNTEKSKAIKPIILADPNWQLVSEQKPPLSVGLAIFKRL